MTSQIATFMLDDTLIGVNILLVKEIYRHMAVSPIPDAPAHLCGLMNLRGRVVTVIDLNVCLNRSATKITEETRLLIFKTQEEITDYIRKGYLKKEVMLGEDIVGFLIDQMDDVMSVETEQILPTLPNLTDIDGDLIEGVIKQGDRLVILLDVSAVLEQAMMTPGEEKER